MTTCSESYFNAFRTDVRLRDVRALVSERVHFYSQCGWVYGQPWHDHRMYVVFAIGLHRPCFIHLNGLWYAASIEDEPSKYARWMWHAACPLWPYSYVRPEQVLPQADMQYLLHHCEPPPPPGIRRLLAVSPES